MQVLFNRRHQFSLVTGIICCLTLFSMTSTSNAEEPKLPSVGDKATDFELAGLDEKNVKLSDHLENGPVVVLVLRGYPGYQCPICSRQVAQFLNSAAKLAAAKATVLMVYPGPADGLKAHAEEFITGKTIPAGFHLLLDEDYKFTNAWNLRWEAPRETAFPSTFVVGTDQKIHFAKISKTHGDRSSAADVLKALEN